MCLLLSTQTDKGNLDELVSAARTYIFMKEIELQMSSQAD